MPATGLRVGERGQARPQGRPVGGFNIPRPPWQNRDKTLTIERSCVLLSEKQIPQVVENPESGDDSREALETVALRVKQRLLPNSLITEQIFSL